MSTLIGIVCDGEDCTQQVVVLHCNHSPTGDRRNRKGTMVYHHHLRAILNEQNWRHSINDGRDYCPDCREKR